MKNCDDIEVLGVLIPRTLLSVRKVAEILGGVSRETVYQKIREGRLGHVLVGEKNRIMISPHDLAEYIQERHTPRYE